VGPATLRALVTRAREEHAGDVLIGSASASQIDSVRTGQAREALETFGAAMTRVREEARSGRSLGHVVLATVMLEGGLVQHFEQRRGQARNAAVRRDAERVLEDLRSLC